MSFEFLIVIPLALTFVAYSVWFYVRDIIQEGGRQFDKIISDALVFLLISTIWMLYFTAKYFLEL